MIPIRPTGVRLAAALVLLSPLACGGDNPQGPAEPVLVAPTLVAQPADLAVDAGSAASFSVTASGTAPFAYQWKRDGAPIAGAAAAAYTLPAAAAADEGATFSVEVRNEAGSVESRAARLTVRTAPQITAQPTNRAVLAGVPAGFSVEATGADLAYQWLRDGVPIPGATARAYGVGVPLAGDDGAAYSVVVSNRLGADTSAAARLTVDDGPGLRATSYANAKGRNVASLPVPGPDFGLARAWGGFFGAGERDLFRATQVYGFDEGPDDATRGEFQFWRWTGSEYVRQPGVVTGDVGCVHPRKAAVADFNGDRRPDVFVACHGYDLPPFPGEPSYVLLSRADGTWESRPVGSPGFYHSVTAADLDGDGDTDVLVTDNFVAPAVFALVNDGAGSFTARPDLLPIGGGGYFTVEAADVNGDGLVDILAGGHDWEGAETVVFVNDGSGSFAGVTPRVIPAVPNEGVVLDFVVLDADRDGVAEIYVLRTSGGDGTFYQSRTVQRVEWPSLRSTVLHSERGVEWVAFLNPVFTGSGYTLFGDVTSPAFELRLP